MELTRAQQQYILDVLYDIWSRENGITVTATLKPEVFPRESNQPNEPAKDAAENGRVV